MIRRGQLQQPHPHAAQEPARLRGGSRMNALIRFGVWPLLGLFVCHLPVPDAAAPIDRTHAQPAAARAAAAEAETHWAGRVEETELRAALAGWTRAVALDDSDAASYTMLARASFVLADGF